MYPSFPKQFLILAALLGSAAYPHGNPDSMLECFRTAAALVPGDFTHSGMYQGPGLARPELFPQWAAKTTEELRTEIRDGRSWNSLLDHAATRRTELARLVLPANTRVSPTIFGRRRVEAVRHIVGMSRETPSDVRRRLADAGFLPDAPLRTELANLALDLVDPTLRPSFFESSQSVRMRRTRYTAIDGSTIGATDVFVEADGPQQGVVIVMNGFAKYVEPILRDVYARIDRAMLATDSATKQREFYNAIYGFYQACPYERGTAAIGEVFWAAVGAEVLGRKLVLPDGADVRAMVMDQDAFVKWMETQNAVPARR